MLFRWLHLLSLTAYLGAIIGLWFMLLPALSRIKNHEGQVELLARSLKLYNPLQIGALGLLVLTGAFQLTDLKAAYRELLLKELGMTLGLKLFFSFILIIFSTYQSMAVAHHLVRRYEVGESFSAEELQSITQKLKVLTLWILLLAGITLWFGVRLRG